MRRYTRDYEMDERRMRDRDMYDPRDERGRYESRRGDHGEYPRDYNSMGREDYDERMYRDEHYMPGFRGNWGNTPFHVQRTGYPYDMRSGRMPRRGRRDYGMDYGYGMDYAEHKESGMDHHDLEEWRKKLMTQLDDHERELFKMEKVLKRAREMRIDFEHFTEEEFYVTVLMLYTDYRDTIGRGNTELYIKLAKDFLCDEDAAVKYGEKLAEYYEAIASE